MVVIVYDCILEGQERVELACQSILFQIQIAVLLLIKLRLANRNCTKY